MVQISTYTELVTSSTSFTHLLTSLNEQKKHDHAADLNEQSFSETKHEDEQLSTSDESEIKEKGAVNGRVYFEYLRAGIGMVIGPVIIISIFGLREITSVFFNKWIAEWSEHGSHRYKDIRNCTEIQDQKTNMIHSMDDVEWKAHQNRKFYFSCGSYL